MEEQHKKKRPVSADGTVQHKKKRPVSADGTVQHKKKRPVSADGTVQQKKKRPVSADGTVQHKKKRPVSADGTVQQKKKRPVSADGTVQQKKKRPVSADGTVQQKKKRPVSADGTVQQKKKRPAAAQHTGSRSTAARRPAAAQNRNRRAAAKASPVPRFFGTAVFILIAVIYIIILSFIIRSKVSRANSYLSEYELSRPQYKMDEYIAGLSDGFFSDMLAKSAETLEFSQYETPALLENALRAEPDDNAKYEYEKTADFTEARPSYYITRNGEAIASTTFERTGWTEKHNFPVWKVGEPQSVITVQAQPAYTVAVTAPKDATVKLNGVAVPDEQFTDAPSELTLTQNEQFFMQQPVSKMCEISGLYLVPELEVTDANGNVLEPETTPDPSDARQEFVFAHADEKNPDEALLNRVHDLTLAYMDYTINTRCTLEQNLAVLNNYLLPGSYLANLMQMISSDIWYNNDPNMREDHVYEVRHVRMYAENLCTVDVHLESTIGKVAVNDYICTIRWTLVNNGYGWYASNIVLLP